MQGVGFRYTIERMAQRFPVTGFVKNLPAGRVELTAEGEEESLREFLAEIRKTFHSSIRDVDIQWGKATGEYNSFTIRF